VCRPPLAHDVRVSSDLGRPVGTGVAATGPSAPPPAATRSATPGWRDPRLWIGVAIVAVSVVVGARVLSSADDTVAVWAVAGDVGSGDALGEPDLVSTRVRFSDEADLARYFRVEDELPPDLTTTRTLGAGELLPRSALGSAEDADTVDVSLEVTPGLVPPEVGVGSVVSVYLVAAPVEEGGTATGDAPRTETDAGVPALSGVTVVDAPATSQVTPGLGRQLVVAVDARDVAGYYRRLGALEAPLASVTLDR